MAEKDKKITFELKDLTYEELLNSYEEVSSFLSFLEEAKVAVKGKGLNSKDDTPENLDEIIDDEEPGDSPAPSAKPSPAPMPVKVAPPSPAPKEEIDTLFDSNDDDDDDEDNSLPKMKGAS